jgi:hypothetical protein
MGGLRIKSVLGVVASLTLCAAIVGPASAGAAKAPSEFFGISAEHPSESDFAGMGSAGFGAYRVPVNWSSIQATRDGGYDWAGLDAQIRFATENGLRPVPVVFGTPGFVHATTQQKLYPPVSRDDLNEWQDFNEALATRYGPGGDFFDENPDVETLPVITWIEWNEQNVQNNWRPKPDPRQYAKLVQAADKGLSAAQPKAEVVLGGMFGYPRGNRSIKAKKFLKKLYAVKGFAKHFDAVNVHPYGHDLGDVKKQIEDLRSVMKKAHDRNGGIYVGEVGWASSGPHRSDLVLGKKGQAKTLKKVLNFTLDKRRKWKIGGVLIYAWRDFPAGEISCLWCPGAGLVDQGGSPKPALDAVEKVIRANVR